MSERVIVNVATGQYVKGQARMREQFKSAGLSANRFWGATPLPDAWPTHQQKPYAFKAYALKAAADQGLTSLLWADACVVPGPRPLTDLWEKIEREGFWIANNGFQNYTWTADAAYPALFPYDATARAVNRTIPHCVATTFGISLNHEIGRAILAEYYRLASETDAFCGPWTNGLQSPDGRTAPCGPPDVRGHRHDQSALSVIAWRLGCKLSDCPEWFSYRGGETDRTCLVACGAY